MTCVPFRFGGRAQRPTSTENLRVCDAVCEKWAGNKNGRPKPAVFKKR